ncbi:hypothetical protein BJ165DRAFT_1411216 [Panaeolus papilionaceus]|nr:hypothetical protein BJ165DRAFT_1411216 [Panaeolus papilionaceus]
MYDYAPGSRRPYGTIVQCLQLNPGIALWIDVSMAICRRGFIPSFHAADREQTLALPLFARYLPVHIPTEQLGVEIQGVISEAVSFSSKFRCLTWAAWETLCLSGRWKTTERGEEWQTQNVDNFSHICRMDDALRCRMTETDHVPSPIEASATKWGDRINRPTVAHRQLSGIAFRFNMPNKKVDRTWEHPRIMMFYEESLAGSSEEDMARLDAVCYAAFKEYMPEDVEFRPLKRNFGPMLKHVRSTSEFLRKQLFTVEVQITEQIPACNYRHIRWLLTLWATMNHAERRWIHILGDRLLD